MIELTNNTPFPHLLFEKRGSYGECFDVLVFRMTFQLKTDGHYADLAEEQMPLIMADEYYGDPETSSLKFETDLVLYKKQTDIHVIGDAIPKSGIPVSEWDAGIQIGAFSKRLHFYGPRQWEYQQNRWQLTPPEAVSHVPLRYEYAYGGQWLQPDETTLTCDNNPLGCGFYPDIEQLDTTAHYAAPQIDHCQSGEHHVDIEQQLSPQGLGPMSRWWQSRIQYAGTYDETWRSTRYPFLPDDFDEQFYNSAHPELRYPGFLQGHEFIALDGLLPESRTATTCLPGYRPVAVIVDKDNHTHTLAPCLDTLTINIDEHLLYTTWRLTIPRTLGMRGGILGCFIPPQVKGTCYG